MSNLFDNFALTYDRMINWPKRLQREKPFFKEIFTLNKVESVLDAACGTGWHSILFAQEGYQVAGADISAAMVEVARSNAAAEKVAVNFQVAGFNDLSKEALGSFDAITCLGNSLPHLLEKEDLLGTCSNFYNLLNPGGVLIIQLRNYFKAIKENQRFMPLNTYNDNSGEYLFFRMQDFHPEKVYFSIVTFHRPPEGQWKYHSETNELRPWDKEEITDNLAKAGFEEVKCFGDFELNQYDQNKDTDLIIIAKKTRGD